MTDLEKRAEQIREELSIEDKTNLVAKAIIELVKEKEDFICFQDISFKIQDYFLLPHCKPYVIHCSGSSDGAGASLPYYLKKLCNIDLYLNNLKPIYLVIVPKRRNILVREFFKYYKAENGKEYKGGEEDRKNALKKICNGDYDFLLKPIPILDKIKVEKNIEPINVPKTTPPIIPSTVLFGDMFGHNLFLPIWDPTNKAIVSDVIVINKT